MEGNMKRKKKQDPHGRFQRVRPLRRGARLKYGSLLKRVRMETGMMRFGDDWPGLFIRGDDAIGLMLSVRATLDFAGKWLPPVRLVEIAMDLHRLSTIADLIDRDVVVSQSSDRKSGGTREDRRVEEQGGMNGEEPVNE
jgi:hypothetical protein